MNPITPTTSPSAPPTILVPGHDVFLQRVRRFEQLADGHSLGDWLRFLGLLSHAQHDSLLAFPTVPLPDAVACAQAREHRMPPLPAQSLPRNTAWRGALYAIVKALMPAAPAEARLALGGLLDLPPEKLETLAERVLHTELYGDDAALLPYIGAALQVYWTVLAQRAPPLGALDVPGICPCCGFLPVASIVKAVGEIGNLRYLHCALCNTEWNLVRVKCAACDSNTGIAYRELEGNTVEQPGAMRAETCDECRSYLKIVYQEKGGVDPVADDLATLALDILVDESGYARAGPNLLMVPGG